MTKQEIKDSVEQIVRLEQDALLDLCSAATETVDMLEEELNQYGYFLGESGPDLIVYRKGLLGAAKDEWMRYDRSTGEWREPERINV